MHPTIAQATAHETINRGHMERGVAYNILMSANTPNKKHEKTLDKLHREADQAWKDTNNVVFDHQLRYNSQLAGFITSTNGTLQAKQDEVWEHMQSPVNTSGMPQEICLCFPLQVLELLPIIPLDISFHAPFPMMLAYSLESYSSQAWLENEGETYSLGEMARASHILSKKLERMAKQETGGDSPDKSPFQVCSCDSSAESTQPWPPSESPTHLTSRRPPEQNTSHESSANSAYSHSTAKDSHVSSGEGSKDKAISTTGNMSEHEEDGGSAGMGSDCQGSGGNDLESKDESEGEGSNPEDSGSECGESCSENEEKGSGSSSGSSPSESKAPKAKPNKPPPEASSEVDPNASQTPILPELDDKDLEDEWKSNHCDFVCSQDINFDEWRDCMISEGHEEWTKQDKMICDHADPHKWVKHPDPLSMESKDAFKPIKTSEYGLCRFYKVGTSGDFSPFPAPRKPMKSDDMCHLLKMAHEQVQPNLVVALSQDSNCPAVQAPSPYQPSAAEDADRQGGWQSALVETLLLPILPVFSQQ